jgi:hypothetical protein
LSRNFNNSDRFNLAFDWRHDFLKNSSMKLSSLETTPNPHCMKLNLDEQINAKPVTLRPNETVTNVPEVAKQLLQLKGVKEVFLALDFITLMRESNADWQPILAQSARLLGIAESADEKLKAQLAQPATESSSEARQNLGQVDVAIQVFRHIPIQVRATTESGEQARVSLPERFNEALQRAIAATGANYITERRWQPYESRNGLPSEVAQMVAEEIDSLIDQAELAQIEALAIASNITSPNSVEEAPTTKPVNQQALLDELQSPDGQRRLKAIQKLEVTPETFPAILTALNDQRSAVRRWAAAILGTSEMPEAVEPLCRAVLSDSSVIVRRTAGDALSDLGDESAIATMAKALEDCSKLVRWRAARYLNEMGNETAIEPLRRTLEKESEFDVRVEIAAALERIEGGGDRTLPMWMRLSQGA